MSRFYRAVWSVFYSDETGCRIEDIKNKINKLYNHSLQAEEGGFQLEFDFQEAQVLKKVIIFYLTNNFQSLTSTEFESITDFILLVDEILEFELEGKI